MRKALIAAAAILLCAARCHGQLGGESAYAFLRLDASANCASLGGASPSVRISGSCGAWMSPALVDTLSHESAAASMVSYAAGARYGSAAYTRRAGSLMITGGAMMVNYGSFDLTDEAANVLGTFTCRDLVAFASASRQVLPSVRIGASAKVIASRMEAYKSQGVAADAGILWLLDGGATSIGATISNLGFQISTYSGTRESLPLDIRLGISRLLEHAPIRLSATLHSLNRPRLAGSLAESMASHLILSAELFPEGVFSIKGGFNFLAHNSLYVSGCSVFPGFSIGMDIRLKRISVQYSRKCLSPAACANMFTAEVFIGRFLSR